MQCKHIETFNMGKQFGNFGYERMSTTELPRDKNYNSPEQGGQDLEKFDDVLAEITKVGAFCFLSLFYTFTACFENFPSQHLQQIHTVLDGGTTFN